MSHKKATGLYLVGTYNGQIFFCGWWHLEQPNYKVFYLELVLQEQFPSWKGNRSLSGVFVTWAENQGLYDMLVARSTVRAGRADIPAFWDCQWFLHICNKQFGCEIHVPRLQFFLLYSVLGKHFSTGKVCPCWGTTRWMSNEPLGLCAGSLEA